MALIKSFRDLEGSQKAHALVLCVYRITENFPQNERFGIMSQLRRSAASFPANIAEGFGRKSTRELLQFLAVANGSLEETRYFLILASDLHFLSAGDFPNFNKQCDSVGQMLGGFARSLKIRAAKLQHGARTASREVGLSRETRVTSHELRATNPQIANNGMRDV